MLILSTVINPFADDSIPCPTCGGPGMRGIYAGVPVLICADSEGCSTFWGWGSTFLAPVIALFGFDGNVLGYARGGFRQAWWAWLRGA